jgi:hypothetical protein
MIVLDTDVVVDLLRRLPQATEWFSSLGDEQLLLPGYVAMELVQGCRSKAELNALENQIREAYIAWPTPEICDDALAIYSSLRFSHGIGLLDTLVGRLAVSLGVPLHTFNQRHYLGVPGLTTVQPYDR